mmetsp:Transcript_105656/g.182201  ORF Transcript_105656/g.182201 Transcript_105656/m.182201 type:complete len:87 (-) Transcript_105656:236-496(-)
MVSVIFDINRCSLWSLTCSTTMAIHHGGCSPNIFSICNMQLSESAEIATYSSDMHNAQEGHKHVSAVLLSPELCLTHMLNYGRRGS